MPLTWAAPAFLAAAMVCSSMVAPNASGVVPGRKFATVSPAPAPMKPRREMLRFVMTSSHEMSAFLGAVGSMLGRRFLDRNHGATNAPGYFNAAMVASVATFRNDAT